MQRLEVQAKGSSVPRPKWISDSMWRQCQHLEETTQGFETLCYSILNHPLQWSVFADSDRPYHLMEVKFNTKAQDKGKNKAHIGRGVFGMWGFVQLKCDAMSIFTLKSIST